MAWTDDLLATLALERRLYAIYCRWEGSCGRGSELYELLGRYADQADRHRQWLWDLCLGHRLIPPPLPELELEGEASYPQLVQATLEDLEANLARLHEDLVGRAREFVARIRQDDRQQALQLARLFPVVREAPAPEELAAPAE